MNHTGLCGHQLPVLAYPPQEDVSGTDSADVPTTLANSREPPASPLAGRKRTASERFDSPDRCVQKFGFRRMVPDIRVASLAAFDSLLPACSYSEASPEVDAPEANRSTPPPELKSRRRDLSAAHSRRAATGFASRRSLAAAFEAEAEAAGLVASSSPSVQSRAAAPPAALSQETKSNRPPAATRAAPVTRMKLKPTSAKRLCFDDVKDNDEELHSDEEPSETPTSPRLLVTLRVSPAAALPEVSPQTVSASVPALAGEWSRQRLGSTGSSRRAVLGFSTAFASARQVCPPGAVRLSACVARSHAETPPTTTRAASFTTGESAGDARFMR